MPERLLEALRSYTECAQARLIQLKEQFGSDTLARSMNELMLPKVVEELESQGEFHQLLLVSQSSFARDYHVKNDEKAWHDAIHNFLCRSGYYLSVARGKRMNAHELSKHYARAFSKAEGQVTYLAALALVSFAQSRMELDSFSGHGPGGHPYGCKSASTGGRPPWLGIMGIVPGA